MPRIFISYRREDTQEIAGRLYDALKARFGRTNVFRDVYALRPGEEFGRVIDRVIADSDVVLVLIGPRWLLGAGVTGPSRLQDAKDLLRREVATALNGGKWVIPVLVRGAALPNAAELPQDLAALAERNAIELTDARWEYDVEQLTRALRTGGARTGRRVAPPTLIAVVAAVFVATAVGLRLSTMLLGPTWMARVTATAGPVALRTSPPAPTSTVGASAAALLTPAPLITPACPISTEQRFDNLLGLRADLASKLGCPLGSERPLNGAYELFEQGETIWSSEAFDTKSLQWRTASRIVVFAGSTLTQDSPSLPNSAGRWHREADTWVEGQDPRTPVGFTAPSGMVVPVRGFGKLWAQTRLVEEVGYARQPECEFSNAIVGPEGALERGNGLSQPFRNGWMYYMPLQGRVIWVLIGEDRGDYYRFSETSQPAAQFKVGAGQCELLLR